MIDHVILSPQTGKEPSLIMLQVKGSPLLWTDSGCLSLQFHKCHDVVVRVDGCFKFHEIQKDHPSIPKNSARHFSCRGLHLKLFLGWGIHISPLHGLSFWHWLVAVAPHLVTSNGTNQETITFSLILAQWVVMDLHTMFFLFLCEHSLDSPGANFVIFQHCHHTPSNKLKPVFNFIFNFPGCYLPTHMDGLIKTLHLVMWELCVTIQNVVSLSCHCCYWINALLTASLCQHPLFVLHKCSASIHEFQWVQFFLHRGITLHTFSSYALPCQTPFCQTVLLLQSVIWQPNVMEYWWEGSTSTATPPMSDWRCEPT